jgi:plasmid stability protein
MSLNLSIKNVPDDLAEQLRVRAARNHRSLQGELMAILEAAVAAGVPGTPARSVLGVAEPQPAVKASGVGPGRQLHSPLGQLSLEEVMARARQLFPNGTPGHSVDIVREMRDSRDGDHWRR